MKITSWTVAGPVRALKGVSGSLSQSSCLCGARKDDGEMGTPPGAVNGVHLAAVSVHDRLYNGQAKAGPSLVSSRSTGRISPVEALEHTVRIFSQARPGVPYFERQLGAVPRHHDMGLLSWRAELQGVRGEVPDGLADELTVEVTSIVTGHDQVQGYVTVGGLGLQALYDS